MKALVPNRQQKYWLDLRTVFDENGVITAGNASQMSDGASAVLLMSREKAEELGLKPIARIVARAVVGSDPTLMLTGPIEATRKVLEKAGLSIEDMDTYEVNEAFAPVPLAWLKETGADPAEIESKRRRHRTWSSAWCDGYEDC